MIIKNDKDQIIHEQDGELIGANLKDLTLKDVELSNQILTGINFSRSTLTGANLEDADVTNTNWEGAKYDEETIFPNGFDPTEHGLIFKKG